MREIDPEPVRDLLGAPRLGPTSVLAPAVPAADPPHRWTGNGGGVRSFDQSRATILHVVVQCVVRGELGDLRATGTPLRMPLRSRGPILQAIRASGRIAAQLPRDRGRITTDAARNLAHDELSSMQDRD